MRGNMDSKQLQKENSFLLLSTRALIAVCLSCHPMSVFSVNDRSEYTIAPNLPSFQKPSSQAEDLIHNLKFFNEKTYKMAYDVFLANGNVEDAYQIAVVAVRKKPLDNEWRERLEKGEAVRLTKCFGGKGIDKQIKSTQFTRVPRVGFPHYIRGQSADRVN